MESLGNLKAKEKFEQMVPSCYKVPTSKDAQYVTDVLSITVLSRDVIDIHQVNQSFKINFILIFASK